MKVIAVASDIWCPSFIRQKQAFNINSKIYRKHGTVSPRKFRSSGPMIQKSCPRIGIPVPSRTMHAAGHRCWMKIGVCVICHMELRFGLLRTGSRKFYSTLMKDLIDDYNAMIARRLCHGSWILRVWSVNESSDSVAFHRRSQSKVVSGVSGRKYRYQLFKATVWHHTKRIHNSGQNNF